MNIALIAHDSKKELMVQFCIAYSGILAKHHLCATFTTGKLVSEGAGLSVVRYLSGAQGGVQQIASKISVEEVDMLLFFRDTLTSDTLSRSDANVLRLCDVHSIPVATNIATAEVLIHGLERGDLDWRRVVSQKEGDLHLI